MIYVPEKEEYKCYVVQSEGVIRAYKEEPRYNSNIDYRDYYINSSYIFRDGNQQFGNYTTLPTCLQSSSITSDFHYRMDYPSILISIVVLCFVVYYIPIKLLSKVIKRGVL